jgi:hypothetical protein
VGELYLSNTWGGTAICKSRPGEKGQVIGRREYVRRGWRRPVLSLSFENAWQSCGWVPSATLPGASLALPHLRPFSPSRFLPHMSTSISHTKTSGVSGRSHPAPSNVSRIF